MRLTRAVTGIFILVAPRPDAAHGTALRRASYWSASPNCALDGYLGVAAINWDNPVGSQRINPEPFDKMTRCVPISASSSRIGIG